MEKVSPFEMSSDEKALYLKRDQWCFDQEKVQDQLFQLNVHARAYFSVYKPLYLFEVKNTSVLEVFRSVWVRDGGFSLFSFFEKFPRPWATQTKLLIHESLGWIVPPAWKDFIYFYRMSESRPAEQKPTKTVFASGYAHPTVVSADDLSRLCEDFGLRDRTQGHWLVQEHSIRSEEYSLKFSSHLFELQKIWLQFLPDSSSMSWNQFLEKSHQGQVLLNLDPYHLMNGDSYAEFHFLSTGGTVLKTKSESGPLLETRQLSAYHQCEIHQNWSSVQKEKQNELVKLKEQLQGFIDSEQSLLNGLEDRSFSLMGLHPNIAKMLGDVARKS